LIAHVDAKHSSAQIDARAIFESSVGKVVQSLALSSERKESLKNNILKTSNLSESLQSYFAAKDDISRDPFFALVEDFSID
jgi:hypothetical protein